MKLQQKKLKITIHAIERFYERVFGLIQGEGSTYKGLSLECRNHIDKLIHDDLEENFNDIYILGEGTCKSFEYDCVYIIKDFKLVTLHEIDLVVDTMFKGGKINHKCKATKDRKKLLDRY